MPSHANRYQRIFHRDILLSSISHQARAKLTRRHLSDRICLCLSFILLFYIGWHVFTSSDHLFPFQRDRADEFVYSQALNASSPILQNTHICSSDDIDLLFVILSSSSHSLERQSIRETWRSISNAFGVHSQHLFIIGHQSSGNFYRDLMKEAAHEQDLLYLTVDDHLNTLKELQAYRWLEKNCFNVKYIFKTEDDLFVNSLLLHEIVRELKNPSKDNQTRTLYNVPLNSLLLAQQSPTPEKFLFGWAYAPGRPERNNTNSPYYVSQKEYSKEMYPRYCSGFGYLMNSKTRNAIVDESSKDNQAFRFPDIYITGILPERLKFVCELLPFTYHQGSEDDCTRMIRKNSRKESLSSPPLLLCSTGRHTGQNAYSDYYQMWTQLRQVYTNRLQSNTSSL